MKLCVTTAITTTKVNFYFNISKPLENYMTVIQLYKNKMSDYFSRIGSIRDNGSSEKCT